MCAQNPYLLHHLGCCSEILEIHTLQIWCMRGQQWNWLGSLVCCCIFSVLQGSEGGGEKKSMYTKSKTICTLSMFEKVMAIRKLRERPLLLMATDSRQWRPPCYRQEASKAAPNTDTFHPGGRDVLQFLEIQLPDECRRRGGYWSDILLWFAWTSFSLSGAEYPLLAPAGLDWPDTA